MKALYNQIYFSAKYNGGDNKWQLENLYLHVTALDLSEWD